MISGIHNNNITIINTKKKCEDCYYFYVNGLSVCHKCVNCKEQSNWVYFLRKKYDWDKFYKFGKLYMLLTEDYKEVKIMNHKKVYIIGDNEGMVFEK